jgi:hypothetical protein
MCNCRQIANNRPVLCCRDEGEVGSQTEDRLLEVLKAVGARVDSAVGTFTNLSSLGRLEQSKVCALF